MPSQTIMRLLPIRVLRPPYYVLVRFLRRVRSRTKAMGRRLTVLGDQLSHVLGDPLTLRIWDNWAGLRPNVLHFANHQLCRFRWSFSGNRWRMARLTPAMRQAVLSLRRSGFCVLNDAIDPALVSDVSQKVGKLLQNPEMTFAPEEMEAFLTHIQDSIQAVPEITNFLSPIVTETIERFYGSHFKIYYTEIYRTHPTQEAPKVSWLWHADNHPAPVLKVMVYLTDTSEATGAFRALPWPVTRSLYRRGFRDRDHAEPFARDLNDRSNHVVMEGKAGAVVIFDNNLIHKATAPVGAYRDVAVFEIVPSLVPWNVHLPRVIHQVGRNVSYPKNPLRL